eukprot:COSAG01_NODE_2173_length_8229_cov_287.185855_9_plen_199_part_00
MARTLGLTEDTRRTWRGVSPPLDGDDSPDRPPSAPAAPAPWLLITTPSCAAGLGCLRKNDRSGAFLSVERGERFCQLSGARPWCSPSAEACVGLGPSSAPGHDISQGLSRRACTSIFLGKNRCDIGKSQSRVHARHLAARRGATPHLGGEITDCDGATSAPQAEAAEETASPAPLPPPPIGAPCTHCLRHGDPMHAQE